MAEICLNNVGINFSSERNRLARSCKEWFYMFELAAVFGILLVARDDLAARGFRFCRGRRTFAHARVVPIPG